MRALILGLVALLGSTPPLLAQQPVRDPALQRRQQAIGEDGVFVPGSCNLPDEASGAYALSQNPAELIEIILSGSGDEVRLQGYLTRMGDGVSDHGAPLTYFFGRTTVSPTEITFITRQVHGVWWSFRGSVERGSVPSSAEKGYYFLNGTLAEHFDNGQSAPRRVSLPLLPDSPSQP